MRNAQHFAAICLVASCALPAMAADSLFGTETLTAQRLVKTVLVRNPSLPALHAAASEAASRVEPAGTLDDPMLSYTFAPETLDSLQNSNGPDRGLNYSVDLSQAIPWPGTLALREAEASSMAEAVNQDLTDLRLQIIAAAKVGFAEWYYIHRALQINRTNRRLLIDLRHVAETEYAAGRATQQDVIQAELEHAKLLDEALALKREQRSIQAQLNGLLNRAPQAYLPPPAELAPPASPPDLQVLQETAIENHPALKRLQAQLDASRSRVGLAEKNFYPDFNFSAGYDNFWDTPEQRFTVGASVNVPVNRGKYQALLDAAQADAMRAQWRLVDRRARLLVAIGRVRAGVAESVDVIELHHEQLVPLAQDNLNAAEADYEAGVGDFQDVITAENRKLMIELEFARAQANYIRRLAQLQRWTGAYRPGGGNEEHAND
ncbi:MAG TPA: TolC family protein [Gammaproteobacteria bacterium]|jgi:cobalt-zinc-cadmium efflux system outer membrane protein|nr:TolC family protein [Gammaproteobacteria bacterium]